MRIANLNKVCDHLHRRMESWLRQNNLNTGSLTPQHSEIIYLLNDIHNQVSAVDRLCREFQTSPASLPDRSRSAYTWLSLMSEPRHLLLHMDTLALALAAAADPAVQAKLHPALRKLPFQVSIFNTSAMYRVRQYRSHISFLFHEGFVTAPQEVIQALVRSALFGKPTAARTKDLKTIREHASSEDFCEITLALEWLIDANDQTTLGKTYDLEVAYQRINTAYFSSQLERPKLTWSRAPTRRKFGHYQPSTDTVMVSQSLDDPAVPVKVLEFVMYHELLHKALGSRVVNGRRYAHTPEFRAAEKLFLDYDDAQAWLKKLASRRRKK